MQNLHVFDLIHNYCTHKRNSIIHLKLNYKSLEERNEILNFYCDKIDEDFYYALLNEDEVFFSYDDQSTAEIDAEQTFPTKEELIAEYGEDCIYHIYCAVYDVSGILLWENY